MSYLWFKNALGRPMPSQRWQCNGISYQKWDWQWSRKCKEVNLVLITEDYADFTKSDVFFAEASKSAVIKTAYTKTVADQIWFENFKSNATEQTLKEI